MRLTDYQRGSIFGLVIAAVAFASALERTPDHKPANQEAQQTRNGHPEQQGKGPIERWWRWTVSGDSSGFYTFGLIFVGIAQAGFFIWQLVLIREGLSDTQETADAAKEQAQLARDSLIASNRAWIRVDGIESVSDLFWQSSTGSDPVSAVVTISVAITNIGNTPATRINTHMEAVAGFRDVPDKLRALVAREAGFAPTWTRMLLPGQTYRRPWSCTIGVVDEDGMPAQPIIIGRTAYSIAQDSEVRVTTFAFALVESEPQHPDKFVDLIFAGRNLPRDRVGWRGVGGEFAT